MVITPSGAGPAAARNSGVLQTSAKEISSVQDILTGDVKAQTMSPTVFTALVEQGLKVFTAIFKRIHRALKSEYRKIFRLNRLTSFLGSHTFFGPLWLVGAEHVAADAGKAERDDAGKQRPAGDCIETVVHRKKPRSE